MKIDKTEHISRKDIDFEKFRAIHYELNISCDCPVVGQVGFMPWYQERDNGVYSSSTAATHIWQNLFETPCIFHQHCLLSLSVI